MYMFTQLQWYFQHHFFNPDGMCATTQVSLTKYNIHFQNEKVKQATHLKQRVTHTHKA